MSLEFEWHSRKAAVNRRKHGVTLEEAATVFGDPLAAIFSDEAHSVGEVREIIIGSSDLNRLLVVSFTERRGKIVSLAHGVRRNRSAATMKRTRSPKKPKRRANDLQPEYHFDYRKAKPNRFAARYKAGSRVVVLDPDVARVFTTPESVNAVLRALMETMPPRNFGGHASHATR
jgi:uncharacterized DUF497 family protein